MRENKVAYEVKKNVREGEGYREVQIREKSNVQNEEEEQN